MGSTILLEEQTPLRDFGQDFCTFSSKYRHARASVHAHVCEPIWSTVLFEEEPFAVREAACNAAFAFGRLGAVEVGDVLISYVAEPGRECL